MKMNRNPVSPRTRAQSRLSITTVTGFVVGRALFGGDVGLAATLPVPCAAGSCAPTKTPGFTAPAGFVTSGQATATQSGNQLTVTQSSNQAILNWSSFNISADGKVVFNQPGATSIALNKIYQNSPSSIFGQLSANGQIYLINPNGFVFGATAKVNVAGLVASSLGLYNGDSELSTGILAPLNDPTKHPAFASGDDRVYVTDSAGNLVLDANGQPQPVQIVVQPGAQITAADGGRLMLAGQQVVNGGTLTAPDGQVVLAAGQSVYLAASADPSLRGLIVEVSNDNIPNSGTVAVGTATNQPGGTISAPRGNVSLVGLAVNQSGRISATTSVSYNGSVILQAADGGATGSVGADGNAISCSNSALLCATEGGTLTVAPTSEIDILPEYSDTTTAAVAQTQLQSSIQLSGKNVYVQGGQITAPGGSLGVLAATDPDLGLAAGYDPAAELRVAAGTNINLAGSNATVPMSANLVSIQLNSNELEDDPDQRTGPLKGQTVIVDVRDGKPPIISDSSWTSALQAIQENVAQRTSAGGTASFQSVGDVVVSSGATVNVSGGTWTYTPGIAQTTQLIGANGKNYDISTADPSIAYTGVLNPTYTQTYNGFGVQITNPTPGLGHYDSGFIEGFSAGTVTFAAPALSLQGSLIGTAVNGAYQRSASSIPSESLFGYLASTAGGGNGGSGMALGGTLVIGDATLAHVDPTLGEPDLFAPAVTISNSVAPVVIADGAPLPAQTLDLPVSYLTSDGFTQTRIFSDSTVALPAGLPLNLAAGSTLQVVAPRIDINSNITALSGTIDLQSAETLFSGAQGLPRLGIDIGDGVTLNVSGQWTNDSVYANSGGIAPTYQNGGTIDLTLTDLAGTKYSSAPQNAGGELVLGNGVSLLANGGAWLQSSGTVAGGTGGNITLNASSYEAALQVGNNVSLAAFGAQGAAGGVFSLAAPRIEVVQGNGSWATAQRIDDLPDPTQPAPSVPDVGQAFKVGAGLFSQDGFSTVNLTATAPVLPGTTDPVDLLTIDAGTTIQASAQSLQLLPGYFTRATGGSLQGHTSTVTLPEADRSAYTINLTVAPAGATAPDSTMSSYGNLDMQAGASITADPGSTIALRSQGSILVDGVLRAPGGNITATIANPTTFFDYGYLPDQRIELGSQAILDVSGTTVLTPNGLGLSLGSVLPGGTIDLIADRGSVVVDAGSLVDFAGGSGRLDVATTGGSAGYSAAIIGSAGGTLAVKSSESISLLGNLSGAAGASSSGSVEGGTLDVALNTGLNAGTGTSQTALDYQAFPSLQPTIELVSTTAGSSPSASYGDQAVLGIAQLEQSGIDALSLQAAASPGAGGSGGGTISLVSGEPLTLGREISLDAPNISVSYGTSASLNAPYVALTDTNSALTSAPLVLGGNGALNVTAQQIALSGNIALQGVGNVTLDSTGDVELEPVIAIGQSGGLALAGNLTIEASRVYPATQTSYTISDSGSAGTVTINQAAVASPGTPLSAAGSLEIDAANIVNNGTILAPFGKIILNATNSLELTSTSITSVSAEGATIPYGQTILGQEEWVYDSGVTNLAVNSVPLGQVTLKGPTVSLDKGAVVDLSGGGNLSAYEWTPGTGGSTDALNQTPGLYAILPSVGGSYAAYDGAQFANPNAPAVGQSVYLSGVPGLAAGVYTLLPASYGLMKGAYLVQVESSYSSLKPGTIGALSDGTPVVAGYLTFGSTGLIQGSSNYIGFAVRPGPAYGSSLAEYDLSDAASYFANAAVNAGLTQVALPADAGTLLIEASNSLNALGTVKSAAASGGTAATIEISATDLTVTARQGDVTNNGVSISAPVLQSWNAGDLILGGQVATDGSINVTADTVTIASGASFSANQVLAVANQSIDVKSGAVVASTSGVSGMALKTLPGTDTLSLTQTDATGTVTAAPGAALLAVSDLSAPIVARSAGGSTGATINIEDGATLSTRGAVSLDAPAGITVGGSIDAPGASWTLASNSIAFVPAGASSTDTLLINPTLLAQMQAAGAIQLASAGAIDLLTPVQLGATNAGSTPTLGSLTLTATALNSCATCAFDSVLGAQTLTLNGVGNTATATAGDSTLTLVANTLNLGGTGDLAINGNTHTTAQVSGAVIGQGSNTDTTSTVAIGGDVSIAAAELTAASQTATAISLTNGALTITQNGTAASASSLAGSLGGQLALAANSIQDSGSIIVPGGQVSLAAASDLNLGTGAVVNTGGITVSAGDQIMGAAGGIVNLTAGGNLTVAGGTTISVAGAGTAPAGSLAITGGGTVTLDGSLAGNAAAGATGGTFLLDAGSLSGGLSAALVNNLTSGGFTNEIGLQVHTGDLDLGSGVALNANQIVLTADSGAVNVGGSLTAAAAGQSGFIGLYGGAGVTLQSGGALTAGGIASAGHGGEIEIGSTCLTCSVTLASNSTIATNGGADGGELVIAAPVTNTSDLVAINLGQTGLGANVGGVGQIIIEAVQPTVDVTNAANAQSPTWLSDAATSAANYLATNGAGIAARLTPPSTTVNGITKPSLTVQAGLEIDDTQNETLTLPSLDLSQFSSQGNVVDLTVRAAGGLTLGGNISDGATGSTVYTSGNSASLRFVAGADLSSANPLATMVAAPGSGADLNIGNPTGSSAIVRTGTGNIDLVASGNVGFTAGSSAYTTGLEVGSLGIGAGSTRQTMNFLTGGGNLVVKAGQDVTGVLPADDSGVSYWELRSATSSTGGLGEWGVNLSAFNLHPWDVATFGGGDVTVNAGRDVYEVSAATADSTSVSSGVQHNLAGGGLTVVAGRDVTTGLFFVADGQGTFTAGRSFATTESTTDSTVGVAVGSLFELQNANLSLWAQDAITIAGIANPTVLSQPLLISGKTSFWSYGTDSGFSAQSTAGDVTFANGGNDLTWWAELLGKSVVPTGSGASNGLNALPPSLSMVSLTQDVAVPAGYLFPSDTGQLQIFAGRDVNDSGTLTMSDAPSSAVSSATNVLTPGTAVGLFSLTSEEQQYAFYSGRHVDDGVPVSIVAGRDINDLSLSIPKAADIEAGRDIVSLNYVGQNLNANDLTLISAGRDFVDPVTFNSTGGPIASDALVQVGGPGSLDILAGRNLNLGFSGGVTTIGDLRNPNLATSAGASITMAAGLGQSPDYTGFYQQIIVPSTTYQQQLVTYVESLTGQSNLTVAQAETEFTAFTPDQQRPLIDSVFYNELNLSGQEANVKGGGGYTRGYAAIDALFPGSRTGSAGNSTNQYGGDLDLVYSQIYTESGGGISLLVPGGAINVGLAVPPATLVGVPKEPGQLGIVAEGTGDIDIYSKGDVNVDSSRIFTLGGGNILIWSDEGSIDAGKGSKTSLSAPPPTYTTDANGNVQTTFGAAVAGSGIRTIQTNPTEPAGDVNLVAPAGTVDAGEAGIGAAGSINISALSVLNVANINFGTTATGVPPLVSGITASLASAASTASSATTSVTSAIDSNAAKEAAAPLAQTAISWLDVFVTGLGDENCKPDDEECLKRQTHDH